MGDWETDLEIFTQLWPERLSLEGSFQNKRNFPPTTVCISSKSAFVIDPTSVQLFIMN